MALNNLGFNRARRGDADQETAALLEESLALRRALGEPRGIATTLTSLAEMYLVRGDLDAAEPLLEEAEALARGILHSELTCVALNLQGLVHLFAGDPGAARGRFETSLRRATTSGYRALTIQAVLGLAGVASAGGMHTRALRLCSAAVAAESPNGERLTCLHQRVVDTVQAQSAGLDDSARAAVVRAAHETPLERIVTEAISLTPRPYPTEL